MTKREVHLDGGAPWGFRMNGGADAGHPLRISRVNPGSKAAHQGVREGDVISAINGTTTRNLTNGDSHELLRSAGSTLTLGLNQDHTSSPKRRNRDASKRDSGATNSKELKSDSKDSKTISSGEVVSTSQLNKEGKKTKQKRLAVKEESSNNEKISDLASKSNETVQDEIDNVSFNIPSTKDMSSSKARRLRKAKLKNKLKELSKEQIEENVNHNLDIESVNIENNTNELVFKSESCNNNKESLSKLDGDKNVCPEISKSSSGKANKKKKTKTKSEEQSESQPNTKSDNVKKDSNAGSTDVTSTKCTQNVRESNNSERKSQSDNSEFVKNSSKVTINYSDIPDNSFIHKQDVEIVTVIDEEASNYTEINTDGIHVNESIGRIIESESSINPNMNKECEKCPDTSTILINIPKSSYISNDSIEDNEIYSLKDRTKTDSEIIENENAQIRFEKNLTNEPHYSTPKICSTDNDCDDPPCFSETVGFKNNLSTKESIPCVEVIVNPPSPTIGEENILLDVDWENVDELVTCSAHISSDDDVNQEYLVHFPLNDLRAQSESPQLVVDVLDECGLTVQDTRGPIISPDQEKKLRCYLETLELTKPEGDDSSSDKTSEISVVADNSADYVTKQETIVYKHCKQRCVAEPCYIPSPHRNYLDVITEENSDLSDSDRKSEERPWEDSAAIRKINEFDIIPDDWVESDKEMESGYDDGGIKSWQDGASLDEVEGIEVVYLDSDTSDDTVVREVESEENPRLVVVQTKETDKVFSVKNVINDNIHVDERIDKNNDLDENKMSESTDYLDLITTSKDISSSSNKGTKDLVVKETPKLVTVHLKQTDKIDNSNTNQLNNPSFSLDTVRNNVVANEYHTKETDQVNFPETINDLSCNSNKFGENLVAEENPKLVVVHTKHTDKVLSLKNTITDNINMETFNKNVFENKASALKESIQRSKTSNDPRHLIHADNLFASNVNEKTTKSNNEFNKITKIKTENSTYRRSSFSGNTSLDNDHINLSKSSEKINFDKEIHEISEFEMLFNEMITKTSSDEQFSPSKANSNPESNKSYCDVFSNKCPIPQQKLDVSSSPIFSRQNSTDSETPTTRSTTRCTTSQSPLLHDKDVCSDISLFSSTDYEILRNPESLKDLSTKTVISIPGGIRILEMIGIIRFNPDFHNQQDSYRNSNNSTRRSSILPETPPETRSISRPFSAGSSSLPNDLFSPTSSSVLFTPPPSNINSPPNNIFGNDKNWTSIETSEDNLRLCLSPSQSRSLPLTSSQEAAGLLDLHKKFIRRRGYNEDILSKVNLPSPDLIQLEHSKENRKPYDYTPELLTEAANLLALKEYRKNRFSGNKNTKESLEELSEEFSQTLDELSMIKQIKNDIPQSQDSCKTSKIEKQSKRKCQIYDDCFLNRSNIFDGEVFSDSKVGESDAKTNRSETVQLGQDADQSDGSRLLALIQSQEYPSAKARCPFASISRYVRSEDKCDKKSTVSGDFVSGRSIMSYNNDVSDSKRVFDADQYRISKQGDIAVILPRDSKRTDRPKSLPPDESSCGEIFRKKMYEEYMYKVAERYERRQQKVIKISDRPTSMIITKEEIKDAALPSEIPKLEDEFMNKVKERMNKLGISLDDDNDNNDKNDESQLPKHLLEFAELASDSPGNGIWSPVQTPESQRKQFDFKSAQQELEKQKEEEENNIQEDSQTSVVWTPRTIPSPPVEKKTFRPVKFESPPPVRKHIQLSNEEPPKPPISLPIKPSDWSNKDRSENLVPERIETQRRLTSSQSAESSLSASSEITLPKAPNPTITLLQKAREGQLPRGALYLEEEEFSSTVKPEEKRLVYPNEIRYTIKREYNSETDDKTPKKIVELAPRKFEGIGPTTKEGIPIVLRSEVKDANQQKWYKRMYDSLHRAEKDREFVTVRYRTNKRGYPYSAGGGYLSEPDRLGSDYDSDAVTKYATLDRRRIKNKENDFTTSTMPRNKYSSHSVKNAVDVYKNQPGRIEDYEPGHSSISEKEAKQQLEQSKTTSRPPAATPNSGKSFMTYALKESGYESDSQLVFKRRDENLQNQMSPAEQKMAYKTIQKGGEVPLHGLRKPAPERPKEPINGGAIPVPERGLHSNQQRPESPHRYVESEVTIHYRSPVRSEAKEAWPEEELSRRQAEAMRRIYQEERRRKYLQELQDMYSRRHTDNFIPSQKSPIPLNRYDDFFDDVSPTKPRDHTPEPKLVARALYNFVGQSSRELTFRRGDVIFVRRKIDKNWYEGEHNASIGLFPINYVEIIPYDGIRTTPKKLNEGQARAKFNFQAQSHMELSLIKGELVVLTKRVDDNWFEGRIGNKKGIFPVSYVDVLVEPGVEGVSPVRPTTPALSKPVASPAAHSLMLNGAKNSLSHHHYTPSPPVSYTSLSRPTKTTRPAVSPVNQALHIDTQSEPVPYRALYNYKPQNDDELELNEGDTVYVMEKCDDGWYVGSSQRTGCFGTFPGNYVQRLSRGH